MSSPKVKVRGGRVFASDRAWDGEQFETNDDAARFAATEYALEELDLPAGLRNRQLSRPQARQLRGASLGDFLPASHPRAERIRALLGGKARS